MYQSTWQISLDSQHHSAIWVVATFLMGFQLEISTKFLQHLDQVSFLHRTQVHLKYHWFLDWNDIDDLIFELIRFSWTVRTDGPQDSFYQLHENGPNLGCEIQRRSIKLISASSALAFRLLISGGNCFGSPTKMNLEQWNSGPSTIGSETWPASSIMQISGLTCIKISWRATPIQVPHIKRFHGCNSKILRLVAYVRKKLARGRMSHPELS